VILIKIKKLTMKKIFILSLFAFIACKSTTTIERSNKFNQNEIGKCYSNISTKEKTKGGFSLKAIDNQYTTVNDSIHIDSLDFVNNPDVIRMVVKEAASKYLFMKNIERGCSTKKFDENSDLKAHCTVCFVEVPAYYSGVLKTDIDSLRKSGLSFYHFKKQILTDTSYILRKNYRHKPLFLKRGLLYFQNSTWSGYYEISCASICETYTIRQIENRLNALGYKTNEDNILSKKELRQLHRFQKDNGLEVGQLTAETLTKLGVLW
jgi:hypothetical protein